MPNFRNKFATASAPYLARLQALPRWFIPIFMTVLLLVALFANPEESAGLWIGFICFMIIDLFLAWLLVLAWPVLTPASRMVRLFVVGAIFLVAFSRF
jgi:hypothetical protein